MSDEKELDGVLTPEMRSHLTSDESRDGVFSKKIRDRVRNSVFDFSLLQTTFRKSDLKEAFTDKNDEDVHPSQWRHVFNNVSNALALFFEGTYRASRYEELHYDGRIVDDDVIGMFENFVEEAVKMVYTSDEAIVDEIEVNIDVNLREPPSIESVEDLETLSIDMIEQLHQAEEITEEEFDRAIEVKGGDVVRMNRRDENNSQED